MKKLKRIELTIDDLDCGELGCSLDRISIVSEPAIEEDFMFFSKIKENFKVHDEEERIVSGPAMIPDLDILRIDENDEKFLVFFTAETIKNCAQIFFKNSNTNSTNLEHEIETDGLIVFESWLVDNENGKGGGRGFKDAIDGTWMVSFHILNDVVWEDFIKTGMLKGFSVEGMFGEKEEFLDTKLSYEELANQIEKLINSGKPEDEIYNEIKNKVEQNK